MIKDNSIFVCGGEDLKLYKYNYETGTEIGNLFCINYKQLSSDNSGMYAV